MQELQNLLDKLSGIIWGEYVLIPLLTLVGIYLTLGLNAMPWRLIPRAFSMLWQGRKPDEEIKGDISPFQALMTA
ncbi:MAG: sodium:alanine symporter family protein, partial [Gammaproteobacteria bacterium]|nr:sodium:alanine symporter family protein [Gammaproteobacteria bacterium]